MKRFALLSTLTAVAGCATHPVQPQVTGPLSPTVVSAPLTDFEQFRGTSPGSYSPNGDFCLSNGLLGIGLMETWGAEDASSDYATFFVAGRYTGSDPDSKIVQSLEPLQNPVGFWCQVGATKVGGQEGKFPSAIASFDSETGVYSVRGQCEGARLNWEFVLDPATPTYAERWTISGKPGTVVRFGNDSQWDTSSHEVPFNKLDTLDGKEVDATNMVEAAISDKGLLTFCRTTVVGSVTRPASGDQLFERAKKWASGDSAPRILIDGPADDQTFVNQALFQVRSGTNPHGPTGPFGVTNPKYGGRVFWDSDTWIFPALALLDPNRARSIPQFRIDTRAEAVQNATNWFSSQRLLMRPMDSPLKYPWEAGPTGREQAVGESRKQEHVTADVVRCLQQADALGLIDHQIASETIRGCAEYLFQRSATTKDGKRGVLDTMSPDEFHIGDNDLFTNIAVEQTLINAFPNKFKPGDFYRPKDSYGFLSYDGDTLRSYKQAAALLAVWPLQDQECEKSALSMLNRFGGKTTPNGPAMSRSVEALIQARFGNADEAYVNWRKSWQPYTKRPLLAFSESPNGKNVVFLTGVSGCLDALLYGFIGLRIDDQEPQAASWKIPLRNGWWLSCRPNLPKAWRGVRVKNLSVLGKTYTLNIQGKKVTIL